MRSMLSKFVRFGTLVVLAASTLGTGTTVQAQATLRWKFKEGEKLSYATETVQKQAFNVNGMDVETTMNQTMEMSWSVQTVQDGKAAIVQKFDRVRQKMESLFGSYDYDSKDGKPPEGPIGEIVGPMLDAMAGAEFRFSMDGQGDISDVKLAEKLVTALRNNPAAAQMGAMFSEEGLKNMVQQSAATFPKEALTKGKSWNKKVELKLPFGKMTMDNTFTYQGPETRNGAALEKIELKAALSIEPDPNAPIDLKIKSSDVKGAIYFDNVAGHVVETTTNQKMEMEISAMGNTFNTTQDQTTTMKLAR